MCSAITCSRCGKPGWRGCGAHVEQVLGNVPKDQRCKCNEKGADTGASGSSITGAGVMDWLRSRF